MEDTDVLGFIKAGAAPDYYDSWSSNILDFLSPDLSIDQIENLIWDVAYAQTCICTIGSSNIPWVLDREQAKLILGESNRFHNLAYDIRHLLLAF